MQNQRSPHNMMEARFMAQDVIYPGEGSMCTLENGEIHCFVVKYPIDIN